ncbi:protein kinase, cAMP-dependent, regulatory, type II, alpha, B [Lates japonicus]|uniref:Protein kinase, cAMP-dependent, regulatory, type II, alpha, B n=1 Tax=Lates japonicus TaxID=270547 RepID=A0AAD3N394_LATJO|nr:protein kinase, cAMP-dependent, regulatory, type II, alpha, B [Lates japonicus]
MTRSPGACIPKQANSARLQGMQRHLLFKTLEREHIIDQSSGDNFYVIEKGVYDIFCGRTDRAFVSESMTTREFWRAGSYVQRMASRHNRCFRGKGALWSLVRSQQGQ